MDFDLRKNWQPRAMTRALRVWLSDVDAKLESMTLAEITRRPIRSPDNLPVAVDSAIRRQWAGIDSNTLLA